MAITEEYLVKVNRENRYSTSKTSSGYVYINSSNLSTMLSNFYCAGYIKCMKDVNDRYGKSLNSSTQLGGYDVDTNKILERIDKLDEKYDMKIDKLDNKLDNINNNFNNLNREAGEINARIGNLEKRNSFWSVYILAPIITSIITAILIRVF